LVHMRPIEGRKPEGNPRAAAHVLWQNGMNRSGLNLATAPKRWRAMVVLSGVGID